MNLLIAIKSCEMDRKRGLHQVIRETWGKDAIALGAELRFFMGENSQKEFPDESVIAAPDGYQSLPFKTKEILKNSLEYGHVFLCDVDTFVIPNRLLRTGFEHLDYLGVNTKTLGKTFPYHAPGRDGASWYSERAFPWMSGGFGYFLSHKAAEFIIKEEPNVWAEDLWVGQILGPLYCEGKIKAHNMAACFATWHHPHTDEPIDSWQRHMYTEHK